MKKSNFQKDLREAREAEIIAREVLSKTTEDYRFYDVSNMKKFRHRGDIVSRNLKDDSPCFIDVKDDSVIHHTRNILCEDRVSYNGRVQDGFMRYDYDYLCIVSQPEKRMYLVDFDVLKKHYKQGRYLLQAYDWQYSHTYLFPLRKARKLNALVAEIDYSVSDGCYEPVGIRDYRSIS